LIQIRVKFEEFPSWFTVVKQRETIYLAEEMLFSGVCGHPAPVGHGSFLQWPCVPAGRTCGWFALHLPVQGPVCAEKRWKSGNKYFPFRYEKMRPDRVFAKTALICVRIRIILGRMRRENHVGNPGRLPRTRRRRIDAVTKSELSDIYRGYIDCLNRQDWPSLGRFVGDQARHNGRPLGLAGYREMLEGDYRDIPDLQFNIQLLISDPPFVASRLMFNCTPRGMFLGLAVNGRTISFTENVFYEFQGGKVADVWSVIDKSAIEAQL
jgi:predicted ester cyclase